MTIVMEPCLLTSPAAHPNMPTFGQRELLEIHWTIWALVSTPLLLQTKTVVPPGNRQNLLHPNRLNLQSPKLPRLIAAATIPAQWRRDLLPIISVTFFIRGLPVKIKTRLLTNRLAPTP